MVPITNSALVTGDSVDSGLAAESVDRIATYVMIESQDKLELTITAVSLKVLSDLVSAFSHQMPSTSLPNSVSLVNDLAPNSKATLLSNTQVFIKTCSFLKTW